MTRITGRAAFLQLLVDEGVTHLFGNPGTTELPIMEVVPDFPQLKYVLGLQEAGVLGMADGFYRASHRLAAANVHVAPGLGNAMGASYNAKFSGSPVILTAGQQEQGHGLLEPMLYEPLVPMAQPLVKWAVDVARAEDLPRILHRAAKIALTPPTGPVFLDLLRMSVYSPVEPLPESLPVVHISERSAELGKNYRTDIAIQANVKRTLEALLPLLRNKRSAEAGKRLDQLKRRNWSAQRESARTEALLAAEATPIDPRYLMLRFTETLPQDAVVVDEGLVSTYPLPKLLSMREPKRYYGLASGGLGFAIPGAVGISLALPGRPVAVIVGDGAAMYSVQGLWTAAHEKLPITYIVANNRGYRIIKERLVAMRATSQFTGMDLRDPEIDFVQLARSFGLAARRVTDPQDITPALREAFASGAPNLVDVRVADGFGG